LLLKRRKLGLTKRDIEERVLKVAKLLRIEDLLNRKTTQLSGGQQQRVALARALVREPKVWLMDEPLSNLDALIRVQVRAELKRLQKDLGITTVYVTHDQVEALTLADRVAVMNKGRIMQVGTPSEIYNDPEHVFVATFIGNPPMNIIECKLAKDALECIGFTRRLSERVEIEEKTVLLGIRPEHIEISRRPEPDSIEAVVYVVEPLGSEYIVNVKIADVLIKVKTLRDPGVNVGDKVYLKFDWSKVKIFSKSEGKALNIQV